MKKSLIIVETFCCLNVAVVSAAAEGRWPPCVAACDLLTSSLSLLTKRKNSGCANGGSSCSRKPNSSVRPAWVSSEPELPKVLAVAGEATSAAEKIAEIVGDEDEDDGCGRVPAARWNREPDDWETGRGPGEDDMEAEEEYRDASYGKTLGKTLASRRNASRGD